MTVHKQKNISKKPAVKRSSSKVKSAPRVKALSATTKSKAKKQTKKLLVPHKGNDFRPHLIRPWGIVAVLVIALVAQVAYGYATTGHLQILGRVSHIETQELLADTNKERFDAGLPGLVQSESLNEAARLKAEDMITNDYWDHVSPSGVEPWKWLSDVNYSYDVAGENLAKNYPNSSATVDAWMNSETHRANILNNRYTEVGFAVIDGKLAGRDSSLVVAFYGNRLVEGSVAGVADGSVPVKFSAPVSSGSGLPFGNFASILQSMSPVTIVSLGVLAIVAVVGAAAHHYRHQLPKAWQRNWKKHHGAYTFFGMIALGMVVIVATGGGSL